MSGCSWSGRVSTRVAASLCLAVASSVFSPAQAQQTPQGALTPAAVDVALNVTGASIVQLAVDNTYARPTQVAVPINGHVYLLDLGRTRFAPPTSGSLRTAATGCSTRLTPARSTPSAARSWAWRAPSSPAA